MIRNGVKWSVVALLVVVAPSIALAQWIPLPPQPPAPKPVDPWDDPEQAIPPEQIPSDLPPEPPPEPPPAPPPPVVEEPVIEEPQAIPVDPPVQPPRTSAPTTSYPLSLPARPLILPSGTATYGVGFDIGHLAQPDLSLLTGGVFFSGGFAVGGTEVGIGASFNAFDSQDSEEMLAIPTTRSIWGSIRVLVAPELTVGSYVVVGNVDTELQRFSPNLSLAKKVHISERAAIYLNAGVDYESTVYLDEQRNVTPYSRMSVFGSFGVAVNVAEHVNLIASTTIQAFMALDSGIDPSSYRDYSTRLAMLIAPNPRVDVTLQWSLFSTGTRDTKSFAIALDVRRFR